MNKIEKAFLEGKILRRLFKVSFQFVKKKINLIIKFFDEGLGIAYRSIKTLQLKIVKNKIVFMTYQSQYTCNPKYITEKILEKKLDYDLVWIVNKNSIKKRDELGIPSSIRLVERNSFQSYLELMTAHFWIDNALNCIWKPIYKKKNQIYINTWHGSLGIKRLDTANQDKKYWRWIAKRSNKSIDYMITNSEFEENVFKESFWPNVKMMRLGHARNDIFFNLEIKNGLKKKILDIYGIDENTKFALYAPTFRESKNFSYFNIDFVNLENTLVEKFGGNWKILLRMHFKNQSVNLINDERVINVSNYMDMQELLAIVDLGITDYSSWIYDYMLTMNPCFIYAPDVDLYNNERGFCYPLESTPFSIAKDSEELCNNILNYNDKNYREKVRVFLNEKGCMENGTSSDKIVSFINDQMRGY